MPRGGRRGSAEPAKTNGRDTPRRARPRLVERRRRQDELIDAAAGALAAREAALAGLETARASLDDAMTALTEFGIGRDELATMVGVPAHELGGGAAGHHGRGGPARGPAATEPAEARLADGGEEGGPVRLWLAMIERGASPKTHGLDRDGWLLCRGIGDPEHLSTWVGYAFDVDCQRCAKLLAQQLTEEEFG